MKNFAFIMKKIMCFDHVMGDVLVTYSRFIFVALDWNWKSRILKGVVVCLQVSFPILLVSLYKSPTVHTAAFTVFILSIVLIFPYEI